MTTKVKNTVSLKTSQGDVIVTKGKLILIPMTETKAGKEAEEYINVEGMHDIYCWFKPIIISETEDIEAGDWVYEKNLSNERIYEVFERDYLGKKRLGIFRFRSVFIPIEKSNARKILILSENFSPKHLQAIVDGKLKDGDEVYVECEQEEEYITKLGKSERDNYSKHKVSIIKLSLQNHITLYKVEQKTYSEQEVINLLNDLNIDINRTSGGLALGESSFNMWINQHLKTRR